MNYGILLAGGKGTRLGLPTPKQFLKLGNKTLLEHSVEKFANCPFLKHTVVVVPNDWFEQSNNILKNLSFENVSICLGGQTRQESLYRGLKNLHEMFKIADDDIAVSHDVARPFVTIEIIKENIEVCREYGAADTVIPSSDTIVESTDQTVISSVPIRKNMFLGQTPQTFYIEQFVNIYETLSSQYLENVTDAAKILTDHNVRVGLVRGDVSNMKITTLFDLQLATAVLNQYKKQVNG